MQQLDVDRALALRSRIRQIRLRGLDILMSKESDPPRIDAFDLQPGRTLGGKYRVGDLLGRGWEGEVYHVTELATGLERAAKLFFPQRNRRNRAVTFYARKLDKLRDCPILIQYHTQDTFRFRGQRITFLVSELVGGHLLTDLLKGRAGKRLSPFEGLHLLHALVVGLEQIHDMGEYHGDLHPDNVIVRRVGLGFQVKLVDLFNWGRKTSAHVQDDVQSAIRIFYDAVGGARHYAAQPPQVKMICRGLKRSLIRQRFRTARHLRQHIEAMEWE